MEGDKAMPAQDAEKTLKIRRPWRLKKTKLLKWTAITIVAAALTVLFIIIVQMPFNKVDWSAYSPKDSGPAAGPTTVVTTEPSTQPAVPPTENGQASAPKPPPGPSGPTVVIEVPKPVGFDASSCKRWQWKRTRRGFVFDIRCVRVIHPQPGLGQ